MRELPRSPTSIQPRAVMPPTACPSCGRVFKDTSSVLKHMNHRYSSCHHWFKDPPPETQPSPQSPSPSISPQESHPFPGAGHVFDTGPGFLGWFHNHEDAEARAHNPYYPFLSQGEWELAAFLSRSGLLMKLIDEFLSLAIVCTPGGRDSTFLTIFRSAVFVSRFIVHEPFGGRLNCCQVDCRGDLWWSQCLGTPQRSPSFCTTGIRLNASSSF